jgi:hypothetical protein
MGHVHTSQDQVKHSNGTQEMLNFSLVRLVPWDYRSTTMPIYVLKSTI